MSSSFSKLITSPLVDIIQKLLSRFDKQEVKPGFRYPIGK